MDPEQVTAAVNSPEYRAALYAQQAYDATSEGLDRLHAELAAADGLALRGLMARIVAAEAERRFRKEQVACMPPYVPRKHPQRATYDAIAGGREELAQELGWAAAEVWAYGSLPEARLEALTDIVQRVRALDERHRGEDVDPFAHYIWPSPRTTAPWIGGRTIDADPGDVGVLRLLGVDATWDASSEHVMVSTPAAVANAWGYEVAAGPDRQSVRVVAAPAIARWTSNRADGR